ncbi:hypothetical protein CPB86DRAFT_709340 [Serendipita vermifera]|nr:hypothetical protein CPB86DRAFT_709340 [Serendipita vermifera]
MSSQNFRYCHYYLQGRCTFGDTCNYLHASPPKTKDTAIAPASNVIRRPRIISAQPCKFYSQGKCKAGQSCSFSHSLSPFVSPPMGIQPLSTEPCVFFKRGACIKGSACSFLHEVEALSPVYSPSPRLVSPDRDQQVPRMEMKSSPMDSKNEPLRPPILNLETMELDGCRIQFTPGPVVHSVETVFESKIIVLTNLPTSITGQSLLSILPPTSEGTILLLDMTAKPPFARVGFPSAALASEAARLLNGKSIDRTSFIAKVENTGRTANSGTVRSTKVKVSWFKPSRIAWAHYSKLSRAKSAHARIKNLQYDKRDIVVSLQKPTVGQTSSFSIEIKGLPLNLKEQDLESFCGADSVTIGPQAFSEEKSFNEVKKLLSSIGTLESFEVSPPDNRSTKLKAFARFRDAKDADAAHQQLHLKPQKFLRYSQLMVENVHVIRYDLSREQYDVLRFEVQLLSRRQPPGCKLRVYEEENNPSVCIRAYSADAKRLATLKILLSNLLAGEVVKSQDGSLVWDNVFLHTDIQEAVKQLATKKRCWVRFDINYKKVLIFGNRRNRRALVQAIILHLEAIRKQKHTIQLDSKKLRRLVTGHLRALEERLGSQRVQLDLRHRQLLLEGSADILAQVERELSTNEGPGTAASGSQCTICLDQLKDPILLECKHSYCSECLANYLQSESTRRLPDCVCFFRTGTQSCQTPVHHTVIKKLLKSEDYEKLYRNAFLNYVYTHPKELIHCPTQDCPTIYRPIPDQGILRCPSCLIKICAVCNVEYHDDLTCEAYQLQVRKELAAMEEWKESNDIRSCPSCDSSIEKAEGCNHVTCAHCSSHICWVCMKVCGNRTDRDIYIHMSTEHGGIGLRDRC